MIVEREKAKGVKKNNGKWVHVVRAVLFFILSIVLTTITFYNYVPIVRFDEQYADNIVIKLIEYGSDFVYIVLISTWKNWVLSILFFGLGVTEIIEGVRK